MKVLVAALLLLSCAIASAAKHSHEPVVGVGSIDVYAEGDRIHLLSSSPALQYFRSDDAGATWSDPVTLADDRPPTIARRGMDVQIAAAGDRIVAIWPTAGTDKMGRGPMATAVSSDGGRTWRAGPNPADDNLTTGHSFIDIAADSSGTFHLVWLDGRTGEGKGLRYARSTAGGATWSANVTLNPSTCECCWNTLAIGGDDSIAVLYRRRDPRDMAFIRSRDGGSTWSTPVTVGAFDWNIDACPHIGGGLVLNERGAHAIVWTAKDSAALGIYALSSADAGLTWNPPRRLGSPDASRPDLAGDARDALVATWDAMVDGRQSIFAATSTDAGATWSDSMQLSDADVIATHPRAVWTSSGPRIFWTQKRTGQPQEWIMRALEPAEFVRRAAIR